MTQFQPLASEQTEIIGPNFHGRNYLRIEISGESLYDLEIALDEVRRKVSDGFLSGFDSNDTGDYEFNLTQ